MSPPVQAAREAASAHPLPLKCGGCESTIYQHPTRYGVFAHERKGGELHNLQDDYGL